MVFLFSFFIVCASIIIISFPGPPCHTYNICMISITNFHVKGNACGVMLASPSWATVDVRRAANHARMELPVLKSRMKFPNVKYE